ncbi:MAG: GYF domain-containing protein, partial [Pseudomonadota bacterium]
MSDTDTTQAVWYLARDGQQYGPITDDELRKLVELSHLQDGDLVWSPAYSEWQPASVAVELFKPAAPTAQPVPPPSAPTPPQAPDAATMQPEPRPAAPEPAATEPVVTGAPSQPNRDDAERARQGQFEDPATGSRTAAEVDARQSAHGGSRPAEQSRAQAEEAQRSFEVTAPVGYQAGTGRAPDPLTDRPTQTGMRTDPMRPSRSAEPHPAAHVHERTVGTTRAPAPEMHGRHVSVDDDHYDDEDSGGGWIKAVAAVVVLGLVGVGGWFAYESREQILAMVEGSSSGGAAPVVRAGTDRETTTSGSEQRTAVATPAAPAPQSNVALFS